MAADSSSDETEAAAPAAEEKPAVVREKPNGPPRPPRPAARMSGAVRIPLPSSITPGAKPLAPRTAPPCRSEAIPFPAPSVAALGRSEPAPAQPQARAEAVSTEPAATATAEPAAAAEPVTSRSLASNAAPDAGTEPVLTLPSPGMPPRRALPPQLDPQNIPTPLPPLRPSTRPPAVVSPATPGDGGGNIEFSLTRRSSGAPPLSFDSEDVDPSDRAPVAPLTPWGNVPPLQEAAELGSPAVAAPDAESDHEDTIVGQVPKSLLELSSEDEERHESTRAYQVPQELIDLARREREERRQSQAKQERKDAKARFADSLPPAARAADALEDDQSDVLTATVPLDTFPADAAPPVAHSGELGLGRNVSNGPASLEELAAAVSGPGERESIPIVSEVLREDRAPDSLSALSIGRSRWLTRGRAWTLLVGLVLVVGFVLARWSGVELLSR